MESNQPKIPNADNNQKIIELALKYNKGDEIPINFEKVEGTAGIFKIILDGERIGKFTLFDPSSVGRKSDVKVKQIGYINIDDAFRGKGLGKLFYINLNNYLNSQDGSILESGDDTTVFADRVWESLYKDGLVEKKDSTPNGKDIYRFKK